MADRKPDAVFVPPARYEAVGKDDMYKDLCATLGGKVIFTLDFQTRKKFGRIDQQANPRLYPHGHPLQGQERYDWFIAEDRDRKWQPVMPVSGLDGEDDAVWLGYLKPDPHAETTETRAAVAEALAAKAADFENTVEYQAMMRQIRGESPRPVGDIHADA